MTKSKIIPFILLAIALFGLFLLFKNGGIGLRAVGNLSRDGVPLLPLVLIAALVDSVNPCAFSILLLTIAFLFSIGKARSRILRIGGFYIFGIFLAYTLIGLGILQTLQIFNVPHFMARVGASFLILWGAINLINEFFPSFPVKLRIPQSAHHKMAELMGKASTPTAFLLGLLVGVSEFPCTGGPYLLVLGLLHDQATFWQGLGYLGFYNLVFVLPLAVILLIASNKIFLERMRTWKKTENSKMRFWSGIAMIILGAIIFLL